MYSLLSWLYKFAKSNLLVIAALCNPNVNAAKDIEGLLNIKSIKITIGGGIKRSRNDNDLIIKMLILLLKIKKKTGGKLIANPVDKRLKTTVSKINFTKSYEIKLKFDDNKSLIE